MQLGIDKPHGLELLWGEGRYGITAIVSIWHSEIGNAMILAC
jgi:hypothetical protein